MDYNKQNTQQSVSLLVESEMSGCDSESPLMQKFQQSKCVKDLFGILMSDWHNPVETKVKAYFKATKTNLFEKLYDTMNEGRYQVACMRIIYQYLHEASKYCLSQLPEIMNIEAVFAIKSQEFKENILKAFLTFWKNSGADYDFKKEEILKMSGFFKLAYQLKERNHSTFEKDFDDYITEVKKCYGFFHEAILIEENRLLLHIAKIQKMPQVRWFILRKCTFSEINAEPLTSAKERSMLMNLRLDNWKPDELDVLKSIRTTLKGIRKGAAEQQEKKKKMIEVDEEKESMGNDQLKLRILAFAEQVLIKSKSNKNIDCQYEKMRNLLFERQHEGNSLFEDILRTPGMKNVIEFILDEIKIWRNEKLLILPNVIGRLLIDYVIESGDEMNLLAFILPKHSNFESFLTKKRFVKLLNKQHLAITGLTFYERFMFIDDKAKRDKFFDVPFCLLEEINEIYDIETETVVDKLLLFMEVEKNQKLILSLYKEPENSERIEKIIGGERIKKIIKEMEDPNKKFEFEYDIRKMLRYSMKYWQTGDEKFEEYKTKIVAPTNPDPLCSMIIQIIEKRQDDFKEFFYENVTKLANFYSERYPAPEYIPAEKYDSLIQEDMFILFRVAIKHECDQVVEFILDYESFDDLKYEFPRHNRATKHNYFAAQKALEHGYDLGNDGIPPYWITPQIMEDFLDSQITDYDENLVKIDTSFLIPAKERNFRVKSRKDVTDKLLFNEYTETLKYLVNDERLKHLIQHPVVSTYIKVKSYKYQHIYVWNFWMFFCLYMIPFGLLISYYSTEHEDDSFWSSYRIHLVHLLCAFSTFVLAFREFAQLKWMCKTKMEYFSKQSNQLEILIIIFSCIILASTFYLNILEYSELFSFLSTMLIILSTIELLTMLPFESVPLYMMMLKTVTTTFLKFFTFFVFIIISFSVSFFVILRPKVSILLEKSSKSLHNRDEGEKNDVYQNFDTLIGSFFKTLLMLSGEYTIEPFTLSITKMIIFFIFVMTSFVLFNLITGLAITDVKDLRDEAEILDLRHKAENFIETAEKWTEVYKQLHGEPEKTTGDDKKHLKNCEKTEIKSDNILQRCFKKWLLHMLKVLLRKYCFVHKIDWVFVNMKSLDIMVDVFKNFESPLTKYSGEKTALKMESSTYEAIQKILKKKSDKIHEEYSNGHEISSLVKS